MKKIIIPALLIAFIISACSSASTNIFSKKPLSKNTKMAWRTVALRKRRRAVNGLLLLKEHCSILFPLNYPIGTQGIFHLRSHRLSV